MNMEFIYYFQDIHMEDKFGFLALVLMKKEPQKGSNVFWSAMDMGQPEYRFV